MSTSSATKQKAKLLVTMANAVEDSSTRRRNELQQHYHVDSESVEELIRGLEDETYSTTASSRKLGGTIPHGQQQQQQRHHPVDQYQVQILYKAMISYRENAHLRYLLLELRHLDLKQSFVELESRYRRLETQQEAWKQSCQAAAAAGAVLDGPIAATVEGNPTVTGAHNTFQTSTVPLLQQELRSLCSQRSQLLTANLELRKHLKQAQIEKLQQQQQQQEEKQLSSSASSDQVRGFGVHQQPVDETLGHLVEQFQSSITSIGLNQTKEERKRGSRRPLGEEKEDEAEGSYDENDDNEEDEEDDGVVSFLDQSTIMRENRHVDKMNLLGMQLSTRNTVRDNSRSATINRNSDRQAKLIENQQQSILWSPPPSNQRIDKQNSDDSNDRKAAKAKTKIAGPTLTSFLPMPQRQSKKQPTQQQKPPQGQQQMQDIQWSAQNVTHDASNNDNNPSTTTATTLNVSSSDPREFSLDPNDYQESGPNEIGVTPLEIPISPNQRSSSGGSSDIRVTPSASREFSVQPREIAVTPQQSGMNQFGVLDEYGRAISSQSKGVDNHHNVSGHSRLSFASSSTANTNIRSNATKGNSSASKGKGVSLFRRLSGGSLNESEQDQTLQKKCSPSQAPNPPPISATTDSPVEYQMSGHEGSSQRSVAMQDLSATTRRRISNDISGSVEYQMPGYQASGHTSVAKSDHCPTTRRSATGKSNHLKSMEYPMPGYHGSGPASVAMSDPSTPTPRRNTHASDNLKSVEYPMPGYQGPASVAMSDPSVPTKRRNTYAHNDSLKSVEYQMPGYQGSGPTSVAMSDHSPKSRRSSRGNTSVAMSDHSPRARRSYMGSSDHVISPTGRTPIRRQLSHDNKVPTPPATTRLKVTGGAHGFRPSLAPMSDHGKGGGGRSRDPQSLSSSAHMQDHSHRSNSAPAHHHTHQRPRGHPSRARSTDGKIEPQAKPPSYFERIKKTLQQEI